VSEATSGWLPDWPSARRPASVSFRAVLACRMCAAIAPDKRTSVYGLRPDASKSSKEGRYGHVPRTLLPQLGIRDGTK
jgi:hypothetical protein